jgi:hypothetical protein
MPPSVFGRNLQCELVRKWTPERNAIDRTHVFFCCKVGSIHTTGSSRSTNVLVGAAGQTLSDTIMTMREEFLFFPMRNMLCVLTLAAHGTFTAAAAPAGGKCMVDSPAPHRQMRFCPTEKSPAGCALQGVLPQVSRRYVVQRRGMRLCKWACIPALLLVVLVQVCAYAHTYAHTDDLRDNSHQQTLPMPASPIPAGAKTNAAV